MIRNIISFIYSFKPLNRRAFPRYQAAPPLHCTCSFWSFGSEKISNAQIQDCSLAGVLFMANECRILPHTKVSIRLQLPGQEPALQLEGVVVRTFRRSKGSLYFHGVKISAADSPAIRVLVNSISAAQRGKS